MYKTTETMHYKQRENKMQFINEHNTQLYMHLPCLL